MPEALAYAKRAFELNENIESVQINYVDHLLQAEQIVNCFSFELVHFFLFSLLQADALDVLERILAIDSTKTWAQFRLGLVSLRLNNIHNAVKSLQIVSRRPNASG